MSKLPLNLIVFCTTMGHGGRHTYKDGIINLYDKIDSNLFANKSSALATAMTDIFALLFALSKLDMEV